MFKPAYLVSVIFCLCCLSCGVNPEVASETAVVRLDVLLDDFDSMDYARQAEVVHELRPELSAMFTVLGDPDITVQSLDDWGRSRVVEVFQPAVDSVYRDIRPLEDAIGHILSSAMKDSLELPDNLRFATVTWGNPRPIARVDSVVLIALNHFLGEDYPGYAQWPEFRRAEKTPAQLPYYVAAALAATQYPMHESESTTMLSWMLYEGALTEAKMRLVPRASLALALGYSPEQLRYAESHAEAIWQEMAVRKIVYDTDPSVIQKYIGPAPHSPLLAGEAPGRIGRYIGYRIVRSYLDRHPAVPLCRLLSPEVYDEQQTLIDSGFNGR